MASEKVLRFGLKHKNLFPFRHVIDRVEQKTVETGSSLRQWWTAATGIGLGLGLANGVASASEPVVHPPHVHWTHDTHLGAYDSASIRRGFEVYRNVCSTCHSLKFIHFRHLIGVSHTEEQAKALAKSYDILDGPNDKGQMFERPGKLVDRFPSPYKNDEEARAANGGALPPDLSCISKARHGGPSYIWGLITGYKDPPAGMELRQGLHYNPYFPGGAISMAPPLSDGQVEYEDGTPATVNQMAKDVAAFLKWASEPEQDERKKFGFKALTLFAVAAVASAYNKRRIWNVLKTRKVWYKPVAPYRVYGAKRR